MHLALGFQMLMMTQTAETTQECCNLEPKPVRGAKESISF